MPLLAGGVAPEELHGTPQLHSEQARSDPEVDQTSFWCQESILDIFPRTPCLCHQFLFVRSGILAHKRFLFFFVSHLACIQGSLTNSSRILLDSLIQKSSSSLKPSIDDPDAAALDDFLAVTCRARNIADGYRRAAMLEKKARAIPTNENNSAQRQCSQAFVDGCLSWFCSQRGCDPAMTELVEAVLRWKWRWCRLWLP